MAQTRIYAGTASLWEGESPTFTAGIVKQPGGTLLTPADVVSFTITVFKMNGTAPATEAYSNGPLIPGAGYLATPGTAANGKLYNFQFTLDANLFAMEGGSHYRVQIATVTLTYNNLQVYDIQMGSVL